MIRVLLVDDEPAILEITQLYIEDSGNMEVDTASGGQEAILMLAEGRYDAVVSDYEMPGMDGIELLTKVREMDRDIPFILFTGRGREDVIIKALNLGADFYLQKGGEPRSQFAELIHQIRAAVSNKQSERDIHQLNRALLTIRNLNQLIAMEGDVDALLKRACDTLINSRGYYNVWIALVDGEGRISRTAEAGLGEDFDSMLRLFERGHMSSCARKALGKGGVVARVNPSPQCRGCPLSELHRGRGELTICIEHGLRTYGILNVSLPSEQMDDEVERTLLDEISKDIAFALHRIGLQEEKRRTERLNEVFFRSTGTAMVIIDSDGTIVEMNHDFSRLSDMGRSQVLGRRGWVDFVHPDDRDMMLSYHDMRNEDPSRAPDSYEFRLLRPDGEVRNILLTLSLIPGTRERVASLIDITEIHQYREALKAANIKLNLLSSITRHDVSNSITASLGYLDLVYARLPQDRDMLRYLQRVRELNERIRVQIQEGKEYQDLGTVEPAWHDLSELVHRAIQTIDMEDVMVEVDLEGVRVLADPLIGRVFLNLMDNSLRHGDGPSRIAIGFRENGDGGTLYIEDDGVGIEPGNKERIFEHGFGHNTGLGLFLVRQVLEFTGMSIRENGKWKRGARFEIRVPGRSWRSGD